MLAGIIFLISRNRMWAFSFLIGAWAHVLSDTLDSVGVMLFFPFTTWHAHLDVWQYVGAGGRRRTDAIAYYTSLGGVWDIFWAVWLAFRWRDFTSEYFHREVVPRDTFWLWLRTKASDDVMLTVYRASAFFGVASIIGWYIWALLHQRLPQHPRLDAGRPAVGPAPGAALEARARGLLVGHGGPGDPRAVHRRAAPAVAAQDRAHEGPQAHVERHAHQAGAAARAARSPRACAGPRTRSRAPRASRACSAGAAGRPRGAARGG